MVQWDVRSILYGGPIELFLGPVCSLAGLTKARVCAILCGMMPIKEPLLLIRKSSHVVAAGFLSPYLCGSLPYV